MLAAMGLIVVASVAARAQAPVEAGPVPTPPESAVERQARAAKLREVYWKSSAEWPAPQVDPGVDWRELGLLPTPPSPADDPPTPAKVELGKRLFFDPRVSGSGQIACASCHDPDLGWADGRTTAYGHSREPLKRNSPSIMNLAYMPELFWDGRASSLEDQAREVILNPSEMSATPESILASLAVVPEYRDAFREAYGSDRIDVESTAKALAAFERSVVGGRSAFDKFLRGNRQALSDEAVLGLDLFRGKARCLNCHNGPAFSDGRLHDLGLSYYGRELEDLGRYKVTNRAEDVGRFRTPSLRNITATGPYMHNGLFELSGVLNMYNAGMATLKRKPEQADDPLFPAKSPLLKPLGLTRQELNDLQAFLASLAEPKLRVRAPVLPGLDASRPR
ncbi:cytochrome-c peroxidase [Planctomyces sp. SH-PL62]|uniref:cytochrome-c peroxidase n=1 Tax=Planctomyces sp. SH-PL62 TaxID=1636152 RepID=UPI00078CADE6|nr:cytochrome c peroxidase [Planctomyces sp. SH-PL62]AMV38222.1 Cytochrome c551 peroxidase precursor [Planctomyces sp. SH-PL62]